MSNKEYRTAATRGGAVSRHRHRQHHLKLLTVIVTLTTLHDIIPLDVDELKTLLNYIAKKFMGFDLSDHHANEVRSRSEWDQMLASKGQALNSMTASSPLRGYVSPH